MGAGDSTTPSHIHCAVAGRQHSIQHRPEEQQEARHPGPSSQLERLIWENLCGLSHPGALWSLAGPELLKNFFLFFLSRLGPFLGRKLLQGISAEWFLSSPLFSWKNLVC